MPLSPLTVTADYGDTPPSYAPRIFLELEDGYTGSFNFEEPAGSSVYSERISSGYMTDYVSRVGVGQSISDIDCGVDFSASPDLHVNVSVTPDPPTPATDLYVSTEFNQNVSFSPKIVMELIDGTIKEYIFTPQGMYYTFPIPASDVTDQVQSIHIEDDQGNIIPDEIFFGSLDELEITTIAPNGPTEPPTNRASIWAYRP